MTFTYTADNKVVLPPLPANNPGKVAITINAATGAVSGNFTLVETAPPLTRSKVPFIGQVVRLANGAVKAVGYFLLPQIPTGGQTAAKAPMLSGGFSLQNGPPPPVTLPTAVKDVAFTHSLIGSGGLAPYTWELNTGALPPGLTLSSAGVLSGTPTAAGIFTFSVNMTDAGNITVIKDFTLTISATLVPPVVQPITFPPATIGAEFNFTVAALNSPKTFTVTGLPKGLKFTATTRLISGRPDVSGIFNVQVRATNAAGASAMVTAPLTVETLDKNFVGTFGGLVARDPVNRGLGGSLTVTTTSIGSYSIKLVSALGTGTASTSSAATGRLAASAPHIVAQLGGQPLSLTFNAATGEMTGTLGTAAVTGWRSFWNTLANPAQRLQGYYSFALNLTDAQDIGVASIPQGTGFATFSVSLSGNLSIVGKTADGESITSASFLGANGEFGLYSPLYKNLGTILGPLSLSQDADGQFVDNIISGALTSFKPTTTTRVHAATFGPVNLTAEGAYLAPANKGGVVLGLPEAGSVQLAFTDGGLADSITNPDLTFTYTGDNKVVLPTLAANPGKVAITVNAATGAVSGNFTLVETAPPLTRSKVPFIGQVVRLADGAVKAAGYFLLPQIPTIGQTAATAPMLSGGFSLQQPAP
ncbi:MAG: Ig domain-containing protein [Prosthecobacter sp.]|nr:Ig domain-containing protein [Prosthecobacter sp.]